MVSPITFEVVESLQHELAKAQPGSTQEGILEKALDYALSDDRPRVSAPFLQHDVLRDARKAVYRTAALAQRFQSQLDHIVARGGRLAGFGLVDSGSPERLFLASELEGAVRSEISRRSGSMGIRCFDGMLDGDSVDESARTLEVSASTIDRTRRQVRRITAALLGAAT
jgi:hypothetical protein